MNRSRELVCLLPANWDSFFSHCFCVINTANGKDDDDDDDGDDAAVDDDIDDDDEGGVF